MVVSEMNCTAQIIDCREDDGAYRDGLRANNRRLLWEDICAELIDNSLEHSGDVCRISMEWNKAGGKTFRAVDDGDGSTDIQAFFKPGKSVQTGRSKGNSTFGVGLYVCECCVSSSEHPGQLKVATCTGSDSILVGLRRIDRGSSVESFPVIANDEGRRDYGLGYTGTSVTFSRFAKPLPTLEDTSRIASKLGRSYATAIQSGALVIDLIRNGSATRVESETLPECDDLKTAVIEIDGHTFTVEWGVTKTHCRDNGCRLIYGGKFFDKSQEPCGEYRIGRFYAAVRIPRTIGRESMDILKRAIDNSSIDSLYDELAKLFQPELEASDAICKEGDDEVLNAQISSLLSLAIKSPAKNHEEDESGNDDIRDSNGRDPDGVGVKPRNTGRTRKGRRGPGTKSQLPDSILSCWAPFGTDKGLAEYQHDAMRITFNEDVPMMLHLRESKQVSILASIAAGHVAKDIEGTDKQKQLGFGDSDFAWIYRTMMERVYRGIQTTEAAT